MAPWDSFKSPFKAKTWSPIGVNGKAIDRLFDFCAHSIRATSFAGVSLNWARRGGCLCFSGMICYALSIPLHCSLLDSKA